MVELTLQDKEVLEKIAKEEGWVDDWFETAIVSSRQATEQRCLKEIDKLILETKQGYKFPDDIEQGIIYPDKIEILKELKKRLEMR